jgi:hypothetical protein
LSRARHVSQVTEKSSTERSLRLGAVGLECCGRTIWPPVIRGVTAGLFSHP